MTISTTINVVQYNGNGVTTDFSFPYLFYSDTHLQVFVIDTNNVSTLQTINTDYTVTGEGSQSGGTLSMVVAPASGEKLLVRRVVPLTQLTDYVNGDSFPAESHENALDLLAMGIQQLNEVSGRSIRVSGSGAVPEIDPTESTVIGFDINGDLETFPFTEAGVSVASEITDETRQQNLQDSIDTKATFYSSLTELKSAIGHASGDYAQFIRNGVKTLVLAKATTSPDEYGLIASTGSPMIDWEVQAGENGCNVKSFGAVGDGVTDDTAALNAATAICDLVLTDGDVYLVSSFRPQNSVTGNAILKKKAGSPNPVLVDGQTGITLSGFTVDGDKENAGGFTGIRVLNSQEVELIGLEARNCAGHGLSIESSSAIVVSGCTSRDNNFEGIECRSSSQVVFKENIVKNNVGHGITATKVTGNNIDLKIISNDVISNGRSGIHVPFDTSSIDPVTTDCVIAGNRATLNGEHGILAQATRCVIEGNQSEQNGVSTIHQGILVNGQDVAVTGNLSADNAGVGIDFGNTYSGTCAGNVVRGNGIIGIEVNSSFDVAVTGNTVKENYQANPMFTHQPAIVVNGLGPQWPTIKSTRVTVSGNVVALGPNQTHGVYITNSQLVLVSNNQLRNSGSVADIGVGDMQEFDYQISGNFSRNTNITAEQDIEIPAGESYAVLTGSGTVRNITMAEVSTMPKGSEVTLKFNATGVTLENFTGNLRLASSYNSSANGCIKLIQFGGNWVEVSRQ